MTVLPLAVPSLTTLSDSKFGVELIDNLGAPPRDLLAQDCVLLL
jgi:hypothetical protein